jgi:hypothetical protein
VIYHNKKKVSQVTTIPKINQDLEQIKKITSEKEILSSSNNDSLADETYDNEYSRQLNMSHPYKDELESCNYHTLIK